MFIGGRKETVSNRDPSVFERIKKVTDFDSLGLKDPSHRQHEKLTAILKRLGE